MTHPLANPDNLCRYAHDLTGRQEHLVVEALRLLDADGDRADARELAEALENDTWLCVTAEPREGY